MRTIMLDSITVLYYGVTAGTDIDIIIVLRKSEYALGLIYSKRSHANRYLTSIYLILIQKS